MARWDYAPGSGGRPGGMLDGMLDDIGRLAKSILASQGGGGFQEGGSPMRETWGAALTGGTGYNPTIGGGGVPPRVPSMPRGPLYEDVTAIGNDGSMTGTGAFGSPMGSAEYNPWGPPQQQGGMSPALFMLLMQMRANASNQRRRQIMQSKFPSAF